MPEKTNLSDPEFDSKAVDPDLHKRMEKAVEDVLIRCFNMREGTADGNQGLNFWLRELETALKKALRVWNKSSGQWRLAGLG